MLIGRLHIFILLHPSRKKVKRIGLFGSYVKNEQTAESDIDLVVEFEKGKKTFDNYMELKFFLEDLLECKVDLVIAEAIKPDLKPYIMEDVKYLFETDVSKV